jgi:hypothetical protein
MSSIPGLSLPNAVDVTEFVDLYIRYWIIPVWLLAGFTDWMCYRRDAVRCTA